MLVQRVSTLHIEPGGHVLHAHIFRGPTSCRYSWPILQVPQGGFSHAGARAVCISFEVLPAGHFELRALLLATGVLVLFTWAIVTRARSCSKLAQLTTGAYNTCCSGISANFATQTFVGAIFGSTPRYGIDLLYAILTIFTTNIIITKRSCTTSLAFGTAFVCLFTNITRHACRGSFISRFCIHSTLRTIFTQSSTWVWVVLSSCAFVAIVQA